MMTWHTQFSFGRTAADLTDEHLRAQILDCVSLVDTIVNATPDAKPVMPAFYMWRNHLEALLVQGMLFCMEWSFNRGFDDKEFWKFSRRADAMVADKEFLYVAPPWFRDADVCRSHRSALMARYPDAYDEETWPGAIKDLPILWPVTSAKDPAVYELRVAKADLPLIKAGKLKVPAAIRERIVNL